MASYISNPPLLSWRISVPVPPVDGHGPTDANSGTDATATTQPGKQTEHFLCSSDPSLIQLDALHEAMASDLLWWCKPLARTQLVTMVNNSVCLGLYRVATADGDDGSDSNENAREMVGFARLITDRVTFAYLTDVYILPAYQRRGLGAWMMRCMRELCEGSGPEREGSTPASTGWPDLRSLWLIASTKSAARMYMVSLGGEEAARYRPTPGESDSGMILVEMPGPANSIRNHATKNGTAATKAD
ncbi:hypothetical protein SCUCBS95973_000529 [Sporothrix curviconia]|uniref:N-acetyltransferase domain-containing protein n=1 Tax=Sporothrix curviconia TaxID=1260050 RepID=A0ABP0AR13_9PEZI